MPDFDVLKTINQLNSDVSRWSYLTRNELVQKLNSMNIRQTGKLLKSISYNLRKYHGEVERITFKFPRHGIFVEKGVGRGYPIESVRNTSAMLSVMSGKKRYPKPWFNPVMDDELPALADTVAKHYGDLSVKHIKIK